MQKDKIAISIDPALLTQIDASLDGSMLRSRSQAIEYFLRRGLSEQAISESVLLLHRSHQDIALRNFRGSPLISQQIQFLRKNGIRKVYLVTYQAKPALREALLHEPAEIIEADAKGNAFALLAMRGRIKGNFLAMSGDTYNEFDLRRMMNKHLSLGKIATMGLMTRENLKDYGTAILDGDLIIDFREKGNKLSSHIVNAGIYLFKPEVFELIERPSLENDLFPTLAKIKELAGFFTYGEYEHFSR